MQMNKSARQKDSGSKEERRAEKQRRNADEQVGKAKRQWKQRRTVCRKAKEKRHRRGPKNGLLRSQGRRGRPISLVVEGGVGVGGGGGAVSVHMFLWCGLPSHVSSLHVFLL